VFFHQLHWLKAPEWLQHIGINGNEKAATRKSALNLPNVTPYPLPYSDITSIKKHLTFGII